MHWDTWRGSKDRPAIAPAPEVLKSWLRRQDKDAQIRTQPLCDLCQVTCLFWASIFFYPQNKGVISEDCKSYKILLVHDQPSALFSMRRGVDTEAQGFNRPRTQLEQGQKRKPQDVKKTALLLRIGLTPKNEPSGAPATREEPSTPQSFFS